MTSNSPQLAPRAEPASPLLPFAESDLLAVRLLPAEFARAICVSKQTVSRWIKGDKITLGCDGRLDPNVAMRQVLRNGDPGRTRARLLRQAMTEVAELREAAARLPLVEQQLAELRNTYATEQLRADEDYETMDRWLKEFERIIAAVSSSKRTSMNAITWAGFVKETLIEVMDATDADLDIDGLLAEMAESQPDPARAVAGGGVRGI